MKPDETDSANRFENLNSFMKNKPTHPSSWVPLKTVQLCHKPDQQVYLSFDTTKIYVVFSNFSFFFFFAFRIWNLIALFEQQNHRHCSEPYYMYEYSMFKSVLECFCIKILCHRQVPMMLLSGCLLENILCSMYVCMYVIAVCLTHGIGRPEQPAPGAITWSHGTGRLTSQNSKKLFSTWGTT